MTTAAAEVFFFFEAVDSIFTVSEQGGGRKRMEGWGAGACSPGRWSPFIPCLRFLTEWLHCCLTKQREAANLRPETPNHPSWGFVSKLVRKKARSFEKYISVSWQWASYFCSMHDLKEPTCRVWRTLLVSWPFTDNCLQCFRRNWPFPGGMTSGTV